MERLHEYDHRDRLCFARFAASAPLPAVAAYLAEQPGVRVRSATRWLLEFDCGGARFEMTSAAWRHSLWAVDDQAPAHVHDQVIAMCAARLDTPWERWYPRAWASVTLAAGLAGAVAAVVVARQGVGLLAAIVAAGLAFAAARVLGEGVMVAALRRVRRPD